MPSEQYSKALQLIMTMPAEELPFLEAAVSAALQRTGTGGGQLHDLQDLAQKAMDLLGESTELTGWEMALLAGVILQYGQQFGMAFEEFESRQVTGELRRYHRQVSNITSAMDSLVERDFVTLVTDLKKRSHKLFRITPKGRAEVQRMARREAAERLARPDEGGDGKVEDFRRSAV